MSNHSHCPECGGRIVVAEVFTAERDSMLVCPKCGWDEGNGEPPVSMAEGTENFLQAMIDLVQTTHRVLLATAREVYGARRVD